MAKGGRRGPTYRLLWCSLGVIVLCIVLLIVGINSAVRRGAVRVVEAKAIRHVGLAVIKYELCRGNLPTNLQDLVDAGFVVVSADDETLEVPGLSTIYLPASVLARVEIGEKATHGPGHGDNSGLREYGSQEQMPLVRIVNVTEGEAITRALGYVAACWSRSRQGLSLSEDYTDRWLRDCGDDESKEPVEDDQMP